MVNLLLLLSILLTFGCSSNSEKGLPKEVKTKKNNSENQKEICLKKQVALSCSKYAYSIYRDKPSEAILFYKRACDLGDENSCYTLKSLKSKSIAKNLAIYQRSSELIKQCYITFGPKYTGALNYNHSSSKANYVDFKVTVNISPDGTSGSANVTAREIKKPIKKLNQCMSIVAQKSIFVASNEYQRITLQVEMLKQFKKEKAGALSQIFAGILNSMKDLN